MRFRLRWLLLALLTCVAGPPQRCSGEPPTIRVGLLQGVQLVSFATATSPLAVQDLTGNALAQVPPGEVWRVAVDDDRVTLTGPTGQASPPIEKGITISSPEGGPVRVHGIQGHWDKITDRDYRGVIEVRGVEGSLTVINMVDIETYLRGVVPMEMPAEYPRAALQAQAVAARGQAIVKACRHAREGFDLCATQHCQVYGGATSEDPRSDEAIASTAGEVLAYQGYIADTLYSSNCGGHTVSYEDYWPTQQGVPYLQGTADYDTKQVLLQFPLPEAELEQYLKYAPAVNCNQPRLAKASRFRWWQVTPRAELRTSLVAALGDFGELFEVRVTDRADSGVVRELTVIGSRSIEKVRGGSNIRRALGGVNSASLAIEPVRGSDGKAVAFVIWGAGWGHQVGMCQVGAGGLAGQGWEYRAILAKYYQGCNVTRRY